MLAVHITVQSLLEPLSYPESRTQAMFAATPVRAPLPYRHADAPPCRLRLQFRGDPSLDVGTFLRVAAADMSRFPFYFAHVALRIAYVRRACAGRGALWVDRYVARGRGVCASLRSPAAGETVAAWAAANEAAWGAFCAAMASAFRDWREARRPQTFHAGPGRGRGGSTPVARPSPSAESVASPASVAGPGYGDGGGSRRRRATELTSRASRALVWAPLRPRQLRTEHDRDGEASGAPSMMLGEGRTANTAQGAAEAVFLPQTRVRPGTPAGADRTRDADPHCSSM